MQIISPTRGTSTIIVPCSVCLFTIFRAPSFAYSSCFTSHTSAYSSIFSLPYLLLHECRS
ncbi:hypothetical protein PMAYCL1PPCAC_14024 [Pristionchus mayeri]|uniref:Uncharacterized protein n=1 Tax=Pristionchus mayeri TaxID=1317129 RepID=A0AAN4ZR18_9BILA|nr:hypothetical protein PMAYCL1PPCAC_14024 [Pristionchus mayeri]